MAIMANRLFCYICNREMNRRQSVHIHGEDRDDVREIAISRRRDLMMPELNVEDNTRICFNCYADIRAELILRQDPNSIRMNVLRQTRHDRCIFCDRDVDVHRLNDDVKAKAYLDFNIFFPEIVVSCNNHLDADGYIPHFLFRGLQCLNRQILLVGQQLKNHMEAIYRVSKCTKRLNDTNGYTDDEMKTLTSLDKEQFEILFTYCDRVPCPGGFRYVERRDLLAFLAKLRQGLSDEFLTLLFEFDSRQQMSLAIATVRQSLMLRFVPENIGFDAINRQQYIRDHVTEFSNMLYNPEPNTPRAIAYIDGTYTYCHKSSNFRSLRQTFCNHKGRHCIKPALIVAPDGYILDIHGPYFSDGQNNDAAMLRNEIDNDEGINDWFEPEDIIIVDRGYRDVIQLLQDHGIRCRMPPLLENGENQLTTEDANEARLITKTRWIVEARNGHIKLIYKFFNMTMQIQALPHIGDFYKIAGALINRFRGTIDMENATAQNAQRLLARARTANQVQARVENEQLARRDAQRWVRLAAAELLDFPVLTIEYLKNLTAGIYQIKLSPSYVQDKIAHEENDEFQIEMLHNRNRIPIPGLLRVRVWSRFRNQVRHQIWISYAPNADENNDQIIGYYCTCKTGARTLGACSHVTCVLWYLGYARLQDNVHYPSQRLINEIEDAGNRPPQM